MRSSAETILVSDEDLWDGTPVQKAKLLASLGYTAIQVAEELERDQQSAAFELWLAKLPAKRREEAELDIPTAFNLWALRSQATAS